MQGGFVEPGPGGDPIRNPGVLPTGKNIHALDPQSIPTGAAVKSAKIVVERSVTPGTAMRSLPSKAHYHCANYHQHKGSPLLHCRGGSLGF